MRGCPPWALDGAMRRALPGSATARSRPGDRPVPSGVARRLYGLTQGPASGRTLHLAAAALAGGRAAGHVRARARGGVSRRLGEHLHRRGDPAPLPGRRARPGQPAHRRAPARRGPVGARSAGGLAGPARTRAPGSTSSPPPRPCSSSVRACCWTGWQALRAWRLAGRLPAPGREDFYVRRLLRDARDCGRPGAGGPYSFHLPPESAQRLRRLLTAVLGDRARVTVDAPIATARRTSGWAR
jgi:hypothetical protein